MNTQYLANDLTTNKSGFNNKFVKCYLDLKITNVTMQKQLATGIKDIEPLHVILIT